MYRVKFRAIAIKYFLAFTKKALKLTGLLLLCLALLTQARPAQAANASNPQLEEQVLQILRNHPEVILESVQAYQQQQQQQLQQARQLFLQALKTNPKVIIGDSPTSGAAESKIVLVEFSDFQCPYCAEAHKTVKQFMAKHKDEVTLVYKHFPLAPIHPEAIPAAKAAWAANQQGKFWEYHDALFNQQDKLNEEFYMATAQKLNLDLEKFESDRKAADAAIEKDIQLAEYLGLSGTPFFILNEEALSGAIKLSEMDSALERVRKSQGTGRISSQG